MCTCFKFWRYLYNNSYETCAEKPEAKHGTLLFFLFLFNVIQQLCDRVKLEQSSYSNSYHWTTVPHLEELEGEQMCTENVQGKASKSFCVHPGLVTH